MKNIMTLTVFLCFFVLSCGGSRWQVEWFAEYDYNITKQEERLNNYDAPNWHNDNFPLNRLRGQEILRWGKISQKTKEEQGIEWLEYEKDNDWLKLSKCQQETSQYIIEQTKKVLSQKIAAEKKTGSRFKKAMGKARVCLLEENRYKIEVTVSVIEPNGGRWTFGPSVDMDRCLDLKGQKIKAYIKMFVEYLIYQLEIKRLQIKI